MPAGAPLPSPMALNRSSQSQSIFKKQSSPSLKSAAGLLSALSQADARSRASSSRSSVSTPALSMSSSVTGSSEDTILDELDNTDGLVLPVRPPTSADTFTTLHTEFGHCNDERYRYVSQHVPGDKLEFVELEPPYYIVIATYMSYILLICIGHFRDFLGKRFKPSSYSHLMPNNGYAPLTSDFDSFYTRRLKTRIDSCFSQPVTGVAGRTIQILDRYSPDYNHTQILLGTRTRVLNISSYNYLGFAQATGGCADVVEETIRRYGVSTCGARLDGGTSELHVMAESLVARFVGMEDCLISSMGFATNSTVIPALVEKGCLVISDELNHASIRFGVRLSGANVRTFKHNDMRSLESLLKEVISQGQPKTHRPWKKILVIVEGLYSMEGTLVDLPQIVKLKEKYKFYLFVDEAHSIGALGPHGRGVADYFNIPPRSIDILMGTFTKSFGAAGGYVSGSKALIDNLRVRGHSGPYAEAITPPVLMQIVASMASIMGVEPTVTSSSESSLSTVNTALEAHPGRVPQRELPTWLNLPVALSSGIEGQSRLRRLAFNAKYLRRGLEKLGFITYGHAASPIVPLLLFIPGKMVLFHRMMKDRKTPIVVVVVAYPATSLITGRVRFCLSAAHTKDDIDTVLTACDEIGDILDLKHGIPKVDRWSLEDVVQGATELVNSD